MTDTQWDEITLAKRVSAGDEHASILLLEMAQPRVEKTAMYLCRDLPEREDVIQNTLIEILNSVATFQGNSSFFYWVDRVTLHTAARIIKKKVRRQQLFEQTFIPLAEPKSVEDEMDHRKMQQALALLLEKIGLKERTALVLHYLYGYAADEIADMTQTGVFTVRGRLRNGKKKLRKLVLGNPTLVDWIAVNK
ncbi:MAG: sigma-70 family RNA polymerase sigma factor [Deltaproteobacteria bacterium]|nr:sigma-70 family RNA polymerase sigma factor [Deltaproteobacteria bacterium]